MEATLQDLRNLLQSLSTVEEQDKATLHRKIQGIFVDLQGLNRKMCLHTKQQKATVADAKQKTDQIFLSLQNLQYEISHLNREIQKCDDYPSIYQTLITPTADHQENINALEKELKERKDLQDNLNALKVKKEGLIESNEASRASLKEMEMDVAKLIEASIQLQDKMGLSITKDKHLWEASKGLSQPLSHLFHSIQAFNNKNEKKVTVSVGEATERKYAFDPKSVVLTINDHQDFAKLEFSYLSDFNMVIVKPEWIEHFDFFPASFLTSFDDDGLYCPNPMVEDFDIHEAQGFPYLWAQDLCGLQFGNRLGLEGLLTKLLQRRKFLVQLNATLTRHCMAKLPIPGTEHKILLKRDACQLHEQSFIVSCNDYEFNLFIPAAYPQAICRIELDMTIDIPEFIPTTRDHQMFLHQLAHILNIIKGA